MAELLIILYIAYLVGLGHVWLCLFRASVVRSPMPAQLAWSFGLGTVVWGYGQFLLNVFNLPVHGSWFFGWQILFVAIPLVFRHSGGSRNPEERLGPGFRRGDAA